MQNINENGPSNLSRSNQCEAHAGAQEKFCGISMEQIKKGYGFSAVFLVVADHPSKMIHVVVMLSYSCF
jgi:hypothetical protein